LEKPLSVNNIYNNKYIPNDYFQVKIIDWKLSSPHIKPNILFCDVGGSAGTDDFPYVKAGAKCVCLDVNPYVLRDGKEKAKQEKIGDKIEHVRGSAAHLPFKSQIFDLVTSYSVIDHLPNKEAAYEAICEMSRIAKREGHVVITVPNKLFVMGTLMMAAKMMLQPDAFFEQRFTSKEMLRQCSKAGLQTTRYGSKYPLKIGQSILRHNAPQLLQRLPRSLMRSVCLLAEGAFTIAEQDLNLCLLGARFGLDSIKTA
jgi:ubiquinone/menaquinone biosynthesis C-methylase UbiE